MAKGRRCGKGSGVSTIKRVGDREFFSDHVEFNGVVGQRGVTAYARGQSIKGQTEDCLRQIDAFLVAAGADETEFLTSTVHLSDMKDKGGMNEVWGAWLDPAHKATRPTVQTPLGTSNTLIEIVVE